MGLTLKVTKYHSVMLHTSCQANPAPSKNSRIPKRLRHCDVSSDSWPSCLMRRVGKVIESELPALKAPAAVGRFVFHAGNLFRASLRSTEFSTNLRAVLFFTPKFYLFLYSENHRARVGRLPEKLLPPVRIACGWYCLYPDKFVNSANGVSQKT